MNRLLILSLTSVCWLAACGDDSADTGSGGAGGGGAATSTSSSSSGSDGGGGSGDGMCSATEPCGPGEFCLYADRQCGAGEEQGYCTQASESTCGLPRACGCDGVVYESWCEAEQNGVDRTDAASCELLEGTIACGQEICQQDQEYCESVTEIGVDAEECSTYLRCQPLPTDCQGAICDCLEAESSSAAEVVCTGDVDTGVRAEVRSYACP